MAIYMGFLPDTTDIEAIRRFKSKWGHPPVRIIRTRGAVSVGPIGQRPDNLEARPIRARPKASKV